MTTIANIESYLAQCGVTGISKKYLNGFCVALIFQTTEDGKTFTIKLPAEIEAVHDFLWKEYDSRRSVTFSGAPRKGGKTKEDFREQATKTAWKIQQDWVEVQMSLVKLKQAKILQVFMAFVWDGSQTFYEQLQGNKFKQLPQSTDT